MKFTFALVMLPQVLLGAIVEFSGKPAKELEKIQIFPEARVFTGAEKKPKTLRLTGAGVREKKILVVSADVYVLAHYTDADLKAFAKNPTAAIEAGDTELLQLTLLRDLSADKIKDSFQDALKENGVSVDSPAMKTIFSQMVKDQKTGDVITILSVKVKNQEKLTFDACGKVFSVEGPGLGTDFWKIWFGKPADSGLEDLQQLLVSPSAKTS